MEQISSSLGKFAKIVLIVLIIFCHPTRSYEIEQAYLNTPCAEFNSKEVSIKVKDELNNLPDVVLGYNGLMYYMISPKTPGAIVIECSSRLGLVEWFYNGVGASSGFKVVNTRWSSSDMDKKAICYSSALVFTNITDQLAGEYTCRSLKEENSFRLFVPQATPHYYIEGEEINMTVSHWTDSPFEPIILPCTRRVKKEVISLYKLNVTTNEFVQQELDIGLKFDPYIGFQLTPIREFLTTNNKIGSYECRYKDKGQDKVLLKINLMLQIDTKVNPDKMEVRASAPYLSWTTKANPKLKLNPDTNKNYIVYQRYYTKKDYEEDSTNASVYYLGSIHLVNETKGVQGEVVLYDGIKSVEDGVIHTWKYFVINETTEQEAGLKYEQVGYAHIFTCTSFGQTKPAINITELTVDGYPLRNESAVATPEEKDCGLNCVSVSTEISQGVVNCLGDGIDETLRFPPTVPSPSRPFFIERGRTVYITADDVVVTLPCLVNVPESEVFLFKKTANLLYEKIWSADDQETPVEFFPTWGFHLDTSYPILRDVSGEYICTSSIDLDDKTDMVTVIVRQPSSFRSRVFPAETEIFSRHPIILKWESDEELDIKESKLGIISFPQVLQTDRYGAEFLYKGSFAVSLLEENQVQNITLRRRDDDFVVHTWTLHIISEETDKRSGIFVDTNEDENGDHQAVVTCRSKSNRKPKINYVHCQNPKTCSLMKNCLEKNCNVDNYLETFDKYPENCTDGCASIVIKSVPTNGLLNISCVGDGIKEFVTISEVFFKEDVHWDSTKEDGYLYLYVNLPPSTDQNPQQEIQNIAPNLNWEIGDAVLFSCAAAPFLFSNGIKWAVEMKDGRFVYQNDSSFDPQFKFSGSTQVLSSLNLLLDSYDIKKVWCFAPLLDSPSEWKNISQPIFMREEAADFCHEIQPTIQITNIYPPPSKLEYQFLDPRLDNKEFFILPKDVKQFAVEITAPEPVEWLFNGFAAGPSSTPLVQQDRHSEDFYNETSYCYTSRLLLNLRYKSPNDTGRYVVRGKSQSAYIFGTFYLFVPNENPPYLLRSGSEINETWTKEDEITNRPFLPCLLNDPNKNVNLFKQDSEKNFVKVDVENYLYDPRLGFTITNTNFTSQVFGIYKCIVEGHDTDFLLVNVIPPIEKPKGLKQEKVGEFLVFTCRSAINSIPDIGFVELNDDGQPIPEDKSEGYIKKDCPDSCVILMTRAPHGVIHCKGEGVDETVRYPPAKTGPARNADKKTGLWFDKDLGVFTCQTNTPVAPKLVAVTCRRPNECEIMQSLLYTDGDTSQANTSSCGDGCSQLELKTRVKPFWPSNWFSAFIRCSGVDDVEIFSQYFFYKTEIFMATLDSVEKFRKIRMDVATIRRQENSILATFRCFANRYFYSRGIRWGLQFNNGTIDIQDIITREVEVQNFSAIMSEILLDFDESEYKAVWCFSPYLDTPRWSNASVSTPITNLVFDLE